VQHQIQQGIVGVQVAALKLKQPNLFTIIPWRQLHHARN